MQNYEDDMTNFFTDLKRKLTGRRRDDVEAIQAALESLDQELIQIQSSLHEGRSGYGASLIGGNTQESDRIEQGIREAEPMIHRLQVAREAVRGRLEQAVTEAAKSSLSQRWDEVSQALTKRQESFVALEQAAIAFAEAYRKAEQASHAAFEALPVRFVPSTGCSPVPITAEFTDLRGHASLLLSLATDGRWGGHTGSVLHDMKSLPTLTARGAVAAQEWLALRPKEAA